MTSFPEHSAFLYETLGEIEEGVYRSMVCLTYGKGQATRNLPVERTHRPR
jgi:hypothetical protein